MNMTSALLFPGFDGFARSFRELINPRFSVDGSALGNSGVQ